MPGTIRRLCLAGAHLVGLARVTVENGQLGGGKDTELVGDAVLVVLCRQRPSEATLQIQNKEVYATLYLQANMSGWQSVSCFGCPTKHMAIKLILICA